MKTILTAPWFIQLPTIFAVVFMVMAAVLFIFRGTAPAKKERWRIPSLKSWQKLFTNPSE